MLEYLKTDPDLVNCWHFAKLDSRTKALVQIGENAVSLVDSYPATARERTALRGKLSESMILLFLSYFMLLSDPVDLKPGDVSAIFEISQRQSHRTQTMPSAARRMSFISW